MKSKSLSRTIIVMFAFDLLVLSALTYFTLNYLGIDEKIGLPFSIISIVFVVITGLITNYLKGNYKIREFNPTRWNFYRLLEGVVFTHVPVAILLIFLINKSLLLKFLGINILAVYTILCTYRLCFHYYLFRFKTVKRILIVGVNERAKALADEIMNKPALRMEIVGLVRTDEIERKIKELTKAMFHLTSDEEKFFESEHEVEEIITDDKVPVFEDGRDIYNIVQNTQADVVIFTYASQLMSAVPRNVKIYLMPEFYELVTGKFYMDFKNIVDFRCEFSRKNTYVYDVLKRIFDIISASIIFTVTLPITAYIAIRVKLTDGASPFFTQKRVGTNGQEFNCYKLRTMYVNDYVPKNAQMLNDGSDRVMPFCKLIRKAKLDEIPQMINILKGDMSIVGPRPEPADFANIYKDDVPFYYARTLVKAGWTGWAHVSMPAAYSVDEEKERLAYDIYYIKHRNVFWEIAILVKAVFLAISGRHL